MAKPKTYHQPVLADESIKYLITNKEGVYVDCTLGGGGHSDLILQSLSSKGFLIGLDADNDAIVYASAVLKGFKNKFLRQSFYDQLDVVLHETGKYPVDGFIYDLGLSSFHVDEVSRGFSYQVDAPLDMRFDQNQKLTAAKIVNEYPPEALQRIIREYGEEMHWRKIVDKIVQFRLTTELKSTMDLVRIVKSIVGEKKSQKSLARVFQAIRIEVNKELDRLKKSLELAFQYGKEGARILTISYHSLEDRIVKEFFRYKATDCICPDELPECVCNKVAEMKIILKKVIKPDQQEINMNPRARSARLRVAEKIVPFAAY
jgi:16S rRNA (cytosine1402-N4)-methyltransferase